MPVKDRKAAAEDLARTFALRIRSLFEEIEHRHKTTCYSIAVHHPIFTGGKSREVSHAIQVLKVRGILNRSVISSWPYRARFVVNQKRLATFIE